MSDLSIEEHLEQFSELRNFTFYSNYFLANQHELNELLEVSLQQKKGKYCIYGTWLCCHIAAMDTSPFQKIHSKIIQFLQTDTHQSSLRNWMKVLTFLTIPEKSEGEVIDLCVRFIKNAENKVALQIYSIALLMPMAKKYPEIIPEIKAIIALHSLNKSPAYSSMARKFDKLV